MSIAICPGSFDPITLGHLNIIRRASRIFDRVVACVMFNSTKTSPMFSVEERVDMVRRAVAKYPNVTVDCSDGLLAEYARQFDGAVVVKGLRAASDFEYEFQMALTNRRLAPEIETLFMMPSESLAYVTASTVREIARYGGDTSTFVTPAVQRRLQNLGKGV